MATDNIKSSLKTKLNIEWLTTTETNKNTKQLVLRLLSGILLIIFSILFFLRVPYFGEFVDGVIFDLFLFGTAKYISYLFLLIIGIILLIYKKSYWRLFPNKRFIFFFFLTMWFFSLVFAIVNFFQNWSSTTDINSFFNNYFNQWSTQIWSKGMWFWQSTIFVNGGLWWTIFFGLNAGVPVLVFFIILFFLLLFIILLICAKLKVKSVERIRKKCIVWLGGFYNRNKIISEPQKPMIINNKNEEEPINHNQQVTFKNFYKNEVLTPDKISSPVGHTTLTDNTILSTQPFSIKLHNKELVNYFENINGESVNNYEKNREFAQTSMLNLADLFAKLSIPAKPIRYYVGPSLIILKWELENISDLEILTKHKNAIQQALHVEKLDVYLQNEKELDFQFVTPYMNKIHFADINKEIDTYNKKLECVVGLDDSNKSLLISLYKYPTILVIGGVGSGKGMFLSNLVLSLITNYSTKDLMLSIIDTKSSYLSRFENELHLVSSIPNDVSDAFILIDKILHELKYRIKIIKDNNVESIKGYNDLSTTTESIKPLVIILNDIRDLAQQNKEYLFKFINYITTHAKALNCYLIMATDNLDENLLNIKYNLGFGFKLSNDLNFSNSLYKNYLSKLYGNGDFVMFDGLENNKVINRGLSAYISSSELSKILDTIKNKNIT